MIRILKSFITISILLFLVDLLAVYAFLPETVGILFTNSGESLQEVSRNTFFYSSLILFIIVQILWSLFIQFILNRKYADKKNLNLAIWFRGVILSINLFLILSVLFIGLANNAIDYNYKSIEYIGMAGPVILIIWLAIFPLFLYRHKNQ